LCETSVISLHREPFSENLPSAIDEIVVELRSFSSRHGETMSGSIVVGKAWQRSSACNT